MKPDPDKQNKRLIRVILIAWFLFMVAGIAIVTWGTIKIAQLERGFETVAKRPLSSEKTIETQLQPIYTTVVGEKGAKGDAGKDSVSTHTEVTTVIEKETAVKGDQGKPGKSGTNGREVELGYDSETHYWYQRYIGSDSWELVTLLNLGQP
jgi:hypothetical protein